MSKDKILNELGKINCIKDWDRLNEYVEFCLSNHRSVKIPSQTSSHHILPRAKTLPFRQFEDLNTHKWNLSELSYYDHYMAHYILAQALDHLAVLHSFVAMHNKDLKLGRLSRDELIDPETYNQIFLDRNKKISSKRMELISVNGETMTKAKWQNLTRTLSTEAGKKMSDIMIGSNNIIHKPGVLDRVRETKSTTIIDGKSLDRIGAERAAQTMKKVITLANGVDTTTYKEASKKHSATLNKQFVDNTGNETTLAQKYGKERSIRMRQQGKWYVLLNIFDASVSQRLSAMEIRSISPGLEKCTKDNYLGKSKFGQNALTKKGKASLIGLYVERCE